MYPSVNCHSTWHPAWHSVRPQRQSNAEAQLGAPTTLIGNFQGNAQVFRASLVREPYLVAAATSPLHHLGVLYESYVHRLTTLSSCPRPASTRARDIDAVRL
jgi:hypothetical protein